MIYFLTGNKNKFEEVKAILPDIEQLDIDLPEVQEIDAHEIIRAKLREASKRSQGELIVEDTSLYLDCLNGLPGPLIKWFLKTIGNTGLADLAKKLGNQMATAKTIIGFSDNRHKIYFFEGEVKGRVIEPEGGSGFGWDPIFFPQGHQKTFAQMSQDEKNKISMRRIALNKLKEFLQTREER